MQSQTAILFGKAMKNLLGPHLVAKLTADFETAVSEQKLSSPTGIVSEAAERVLATLNRDVEHPTLVWDSKTRGELRRVLREQLDFILASDPSAITPDNFVARFLSFSYASYKDEIVVDSVFVRGVSRDPTAKLDDPGRFFVAGVRELGKEGIDPVRTAAIAEAICSVAVHQRAIELAGVTPEIVQILQTLVRPPASQLEKIIRSVLGTFSEIAKCPKPALVMMQNEGFVWLALRHLCDYKASGYSVWALECVAALIRHAECEELIVRDGYVIVLLCIGFDDTADKKQRILALESVGALLSREKLEDRSKVLSYFVPRDLLDNVISRSAKHGAEVLESIDADNFDAYLVWNAELRSRVREVLQSETQKILQSIDQTPRVTWIEMEKDVCIDQEVNRNEILVDDVVLSSFIRCPMLRLKANSTINNWG